MILFRWNNRGKWFGDKNNWMLLAVHGQPRPSAQNYPDLPAAHGRGQTAPPSSAGWQTEWADRTSGDWPPSATPAASRTLRGLSSHPTWADTSAPTTGRDDSAADKNCTPDICDGISAAYLMENQSLADVAPAAGGRSEVEEKQKQQQEDDAAGGVHRIDHKHHH